MRVLLVGIGGAGCRIADALALQDIRSRSLRCTDTVAVDSSADDLNALQTIPPENRIFYQSLDPSHAMNTPDVLPHEEIIARLHSLDPGDIDALVIVSGLGGGMASLIPDLVHHIRDRMTEPVFGLLTLPCTREGDAVLARAANSVDALIPNLDGIFFYDNELWYDRAGVQRGNEEFYGRELEIRFPWQKPAPPVHKIPAGYAGINTMIARQISLLLRAGEVSDRPGTEAAEVALDAGEVLNTIRGMGCIAIGYDREHILAANPDLITRLRPVGHAIQESHQRASRMVTMARKAVDEGISISCEIEGAKKALVLVAGPPHELSMRGYMTVRHWIDRSISGQEVRSGDYPLSGTRFIAILIVLSGFDQFPRFETLRKIRDRMAKTNIAG